MIVGPNWKGDVLPGIDGVVRSSTDFGAIMPRIFIDDTPEDHAGIPANNGAFGADYYHRAGAVKAGPYDNKRDETMYLYTDDDSQSQQLVGTSSYAVTFPKGPLSPVKCFGR